MHVLLDIQILFESCSGGGGRFDLGILKAYMPQVMDSDNSDAVARLKFSMELLLWYLLMRWGTRLQQYQITKLGVRHR